MTGQQGFESLHDAVEEIVSSRALENGAFWCVYGSSVYANSSTSDIDFFIAVAEAADQPDNLLLAEAVIDLHCREGRDVDNEVPYETKLVYSFDEIEDVLRLNCFLEDGGLVIPPIVKIPEFLSGLNNIAKKFGLECQNFGHAGDGNVHTNVLKKNMGDEKWKKKRGL